MEGIPTHFTHSSLREQSPCHAVQHGSLHWALAPRGQNTAAGSPKRPDTPCIPKPTARLLSQTQHLVLKGQRKGLSDKIPSSSFRWPCHRGRIQTSHVGKVPFLGLTSSCGGWRRLYVSGKHEVTRLPFSLSRP